MRLTAGQTRIIRQAVSEIFGDAAKVMLFGSRVDDNRRGGDIDLLVTPSTTDATQVLRQKIALLAKLEQRLGERKIDLVIEMPGDTRPIVSIAYATGIAL